MGKLPLATLPDGQSPISIRGRGTERAATEPAFTDHEATEVKMVGVNAANEQGDEVNTAKGKTRKKMDGNAPEDSGMKDPEDALGRRRRQMKRRSV